MENNTHRTQQQSGHGNGFLLGVIVGVLITLLFTTKRGRAIFKDAVEKGIQKFSHLEDLIKEAKNEDFMEEDEGDDFIPSKELLAEPAEKREPKEKEEKNESEKIKEKPIAAEQPKPTKKAVEEVEKAPEKTKPSTGKRWFRGLRRRS
jgi:gas vesicle protein